MRKRPSPFDLADEQWALIESLPPPEHWGFLHDLAFWRRGHAPGAGRRCLV